MKISKKIVPSSLKRRRSRETKEEIVEKKVEKSAGKDAVELKEVPKAAQNESGSADTLKEEKQHDAKKAESSKEKPVSVKNIRSKKTSDTVEEVSPLKQLIQFGVGYSKYSTYPSKKFLARKLFVPANPNQLLAFIPGTIVDIRVAEGDKVKAGAILLILDAMKMRNKIFAPFDGIVKILNVELGQNVKKNELLVEMQ
ncbi:MAG: biotin/lipoyl-binding protein [Bacteroidetes bacterium]|nr:biotin/lipoyl-binding protein [Bacteroidota bacterium]MBU1717515.1 biotin/lipoyl-binding protein [Bacteroidota bacterium]